MCGKHFHLACKELLKITGLMDKITCNTIFTLVAIQFSLGVGFVFSQVHG